MKKSIFPFVFFCYSILTACRGNSAKIQPKYVSLTESVYSSVIIEPDSFYKAFAAARGIIDEVMVKEGDTIRKGDAVACINHDNSKLNTENAALELSLIQEQYEGKANFIESLRRELALANLKRVNDSINVERQKRLWSQQIGSKMDYEQRKLTYQTSLNKVDALEQQLTRKQEELRTTLQKAQNKLADQKNQQADFVIRSRINGKVYEILKEEGELLNEQQPIALIGSRDQFIIKMQVDEVDIVRIQQGQLIYVSLDAYDNKVFEAKVLKVVPQMSQETQTFWVEGVFVDPPQVLYSGLRGEASIIVAKKDRTLSIPLDYLLNQNQVISDRGTLQVVTGLKSMEKIEILQGVDSTTILLKP